MNWLGFQGVPRSTKGLRIASPGMVPETAEMFGEERGLYVARASSESVQVQSIPAPGRSEQHGRAPSMRSNRQRYPEYYIEAGRRSNVVPMSRTQGRRVRAHFKKAFARFNLARSEQMMVYRFVPGSAECQARPSIRQARELPEPRTPK